jgi:hypothetical protein
MFGSRDQRKGSTALGEEVAERSRSVCVAYGAADQIKRRRKGAREEREVGSGVKASEKQRRDSPRDFANGLSRNSSPSPP